MKWSDVRYGTVIQSTTEGAGMRIVLMVIGPWLNAQRVNTVVLACDEETGFWRREQVKAIDDEDFWRFEVVE